MTVCNFEVRNRFRDVDASSEMLSGAKKDKDVEGCKWTILGAERTVKRFKKRDKSLTSAVAS